MGAQIMSPRRKKGPAPWVFGIDVQHAPGNVGFLSVGIILSSFGMPQAEVLPAIDWFGGQLDLKKSVDKATWHFKIVHALLVYGTLVRY